MGQDDDQAAGSRGGLWTTSGTALATFFIVPPDEPRRAPEALVREVGQVGHLYTYSDGALDKHTARGKRLGRGVERFFAEGIKLANESGDERTAKWRGKH